MQIYLMALTSDSQHPQIPKVVIVALIMTELQSYTS